MSIFRCEIPLAITLRSPFVTRGLAPDRASVDTPLARDASGRIILPGTLIQGVVRAALVELTHHIEEVDARTLKGEIGQLFGKASDEDRARANQADVEGWQAFNQPTRGRLSFTDLVVPKERPGGGDGVLTRIQIDPGLGSVRAGFLQVIELPYAQGEHVTFKGRAHLRADKQLSADRVRKLIELALALVPALGAIKSAGFGKVVEFETEDPLPVSWACAVSAKANQPIPICYTLDRPFVVATSRSGGNLFRGEAIIPGAAIKGTLAEALKDAGCFDQAMSDFLTELVISHGFPREKDSQGSAWQPLPRSLAVAKPLDGGSPKVVDHLLAPEDCGRIDGKVQRLSFAVDWKSDDEDLINACLGPFPTAPNRDIRTRTKIDPGTGASAFEKENPDEEAAGQLFSYSAVCVDEHEWHGWLTPKTDADTGRLATILGLLEAGMVGFGKTVACLTGKTAGADHGLSPILAVPVIAGDRRCAVTLMTPALLNNLDALRSGQSLFDDYEAYWQALGFRLHDFYAGQRIEGGYIALRYPQQNDGYEPYLLTEPGSVFLIEPASEDRTLDILKTGLPPNAAIVRRRWDECPFLPENGFGMIRFNRIDHASLATTPLRRAA